MMLCRSLSSAASYICLDLSCLEGGWRFILPADALLGLLTDLNLQTLYITVLLKHCEVTTL